MPLGEPMTMNVLRNCGAPSREALAALPVLPPGSWFICPMVMSTLGSGVNLQHAHVLIVYLNLLHTVTLLWDFAATVMMESIGFFN